MSDVTTETVPAGSGAVGKPKQFGFSALVTGFARMWRGILPAIVVIIVNAVVQALLTYWNPQVSLSFSYVVALVISVAVLLVWWAVLSRIALGAVSGRVALPAAISGAMPHLGTFAIWVAVQWLLILIGFLIFPLLGVLVGMVTAFVPLAAADGQRNALAANFRAIADRWGRWLITSIIFLVLAVILLVLSAVNVFFIHGTPASLIFWFVMGLVAYWLLTAYAAIYRSTRVGAAG